MRYNHPELFAGVASALPDRDCIVFREQRLTYRDVAERVNRLANLLLSQGITIHTPRTDLQPERAVQVSSQLAALNAALEQLTPEQRACWLLREVHGRSYEEIGETVGANATAVRGRIARARAQLAEVMKPWR